MYIYIYIIYNTIIYMFDSYSYISFVSVYICIYIYIHVQIQMIYTYLYIYIHMYTWALSLNHLGTVPNVYGLFFGANPRSFMKFFGLTEKIPNKCLFLTSCNDSNRLSSSINLRSKQYQ